MKHIVLYTYAVFVGTDAGAEVPVWRSTGSTGVCSVVTYLAGIGKDFGAK